MIRKFKNLLVEDKNDLSKREYINLCRELVMILDMEADSMEADLKQNGENENASTEEKEIPTSGIILNAPEQRFSATSYEAIDIDDTPPIFISGSN